MGSSSGWRVTGGIAAFLAAGWFLARLGRLQWLQIDWSDPLNWLSTSEIEVALAALGRIAALALLGWVGVSTFAYAAARSLGMEARAVDWLSIGPFRRAVDALLAGYLLFGSMAPAGALEDRPPSPPATPAQQAVDPRYIPVPAGSMGEESAPPQDRPAEQRAEPEEQPADRTVVVAGDHLWKLAAERLEEVRGRPPTRAEVVPYWVEVVEANRDRLRSGDPDLIFPGEEIVLPPP